MPLHLWTVAIQERSRLVGKISFMYFARRKLPEQRKRLQQRIEVGMLSGSKGMVEEDAKWFIQGGS